MLIKIYPVLISLQDPVMTALDITNVSNGIVVVSGFGEKHWETAIYINGELFAEGRDALEDDHPATKLCKHLAGKAGYSWEERETHIWWRMSSYSDIPGTLAEYDAATVQAYKEDYEQQYLEFSRESYIPSSQEEENRHAYHAYALSGGDETQFKPWYETWLKEKQSFNDRFRAEVDKFLLLQARRNPDEEWETSPSREQQKKLRKYLAEYLLEMFRAEKPLDPVAKRARAAT